MTTDSSDIRDAIDSATGRISPKLDDVDFPLLDSGFISSLDLITVALALEERFGVKVPDAAVSRENFHSIRTLTALVDRLRRGGADATVSLQKNGDGWFERSLIRAFRRPAWVLAGFLGALLLIDQGMEWFGRSAVLEALAPEFVDGNKRLYPAGIIFAHDDWRYSVSRHRVVGAPDHSGLRVGVFGDSGTIGSYTYADTSVPGFVEAMLGDSYPGAQTYNMAFWQQSLVKDAMILEAILEQNAGVAPFDVVVLTLGSTYFHRTHMQNIIKVVPYFGFNADLFRCYAERVRKVADPGYAEIMGSLEQTRKEKFRFLEIEIKRRSGMYHHASAVNYIWDKWVVRPHRKVQAQLEWSHTVGGAPMYKEVPPEPDTTLVYDAGVPEQDFSPALYDLLVDTIKLLKENGIQVILYLKPIMPNEWRETYPAGSRIEAVDIAHTLADELDVGVVDTRWSLSGTQFTDTLAHYTVAGNRIIAAQIVETVRQQLQ